MKKLLLIAVISAVILSCKKNDSKPVTEYKGVMVSGEFITGDTTSTVVRIKK